MQHASQDVLAGVLHFFFLALAYAKARPLGGRRPHTPV